MLNLELAEKYGSEVWLQHNKAIEQLDSRFLHHINEDVFKKIQSVNLERKEKQEHARRELYKMHYKRDEAILKSWQIEQNCAQIGAILQSRNIPLPTFDEPSNEGMDVDDKVSGTDNNAGLEINSEDISNSYLEEPIKKRLKPSDSIES